MSRMGNCSFLVESFKNTVNRLNFSRFTDKSVDMANPIYYGIYNKIKYSCFENKNKLNCKYTYIKAFSTCFMFNYYHIIISSV